MNTDAELAGWRRQWAAQPDARNNAYLAEDLKRRVTRDSRLMKIGLIAPILVTIGIGGAFIARALTSASPADVVLVAEVWLFILVTWAGCLWLARGTWRPLAETTAAFVDLSIRRCRSNLRGATFGAWLYIGQLVFMLLWTFYSTSIELTDLLTAWPVVLLGWLGLPVFFALRSWFVRGQRGELARLLELERELRAGPADTV
jgi:hypothetical protein